MKIAIDTSCLETDSQYRGIGFYLTGLLNEFKTNPALNLIEFNRHLPHNADLLHFPGFNPYRPTLPLTALPFVVTVHDLIPLQFPKAYPPGIRGRINWQRQKLMLLAAKAIITDSYISQAEILKFTAVKPEKVHVVYLAQDKAFKPVKPVNKFKLPQKFVLYVGDVNYNKNLPDLAKTCLKLKLPLVVVGKQAANNDFDAMHPENQSLLEFRQLVKNNQSKIIPLGFVSQSELISLYNLAAVYVQPSIAEGFGLPVLEAMACGCPVLISQAPSLTEIAGNAALLFNPANLQLVWQSRDLQQKLSRLGIMQAANFSWSKTARQTLKIYEIAINH